MEINSICIICKEFWNKYLNYHEKFKIIIPKMPCEYKIGSIKTSKKWYWKKDTFIKIHRNKLFFHWKEKHSNNNILCFKKNNQWECENKISFKKWKETKLKINE